MKRVPLFVHWIAAGAIIFVLTVDPFGLHPVDEWIRGAFEHREESHDAGQTEGTKQLWTCGMHPQVVQEEPGQCPICGMDLVPMKANLDASDEPAPVAVQGAEEKKQLWTCSMHPQVVQEEPGQCPICGMDLVPMRVDQASTESHAEHEGPSVSIDPVVVQNMNVRTAPVERRDLHRSIRTVGYLTYDQEKMVSVTTKYAGFVETVYVNYLGQAVTKGEPLFEVYSPELVQTEQELLSALEYVKKLEGAPDRSLDRARSLVGAARRRLSYWDISPAQIAKLEETGEVHRTLKVVAPASGLVMKRMDGLEGMAIKPAMDVMHLADLTSLWLTVEVFEDQLAWVDVGSQARVTLSYFPGETFEARVHYVEPEVSEKTRAVRLTLRVPNPDGRLRVNMYATVELTPLLAKDALSIPSQAVIRTGERNVVVIARPGGRFAPREVELGSSGEGYVTVSKGLDEGDQVVTSAQFLIDSESNIQAAIQKLVAGHQH